MSNTVTAHTDGSCLGNPGPGGWAAVLSYGQTNKELSQGFKLTTNNRMELLAAISALESLTRSCTVNLYTDSKYVRDGIEKGWLANWKRNGWKTAAKKPVKNKDLWQRFDIALSKHNVTLHWVKGHAGDPNNERCDTLARQAASQAPTQEDPGFP